MTARRLRAAAVVLAALHPGALPAQHAATALPVLDSASLWQTLGALSADSMQGRRTGSHGSAMARALLVQRLAGARLVPLAPGYVHALSATGRNVAGTNVLAMVVGADTSRVVVVSAHYDHMGTRGAEVYNGADDNASGTAAVLAMAEYFATHRPRHSMLFAFFDGEEDGLRGARAFVAAPPVPLARIAVNVNLDMVARLDKNELYAAGASSYPFFRPLLEATAAESPIKLLLGHDTNIAGAQDNWTQQSDQSAFHAEGIPFIYFGVEDHADYHRVTDEISKINAGRYVAAVRTIADFVRRLDQSFNASVPVRAAR